MGVELYKKAKETNETNLIINLLQKKSFQANESQGKVLSKSDIKIMKLKRSSNKNSFIRVNSKEQIYTFVQSILKYLC